MKALLTISGQPEERGELDVMADRLRAKFAADELIQTFPIEVVVDTAKPKLKRGRKSKSKKKK